MESGEWSIAGDAGAEGIAVRAGDPPPAAAVRPVRAANLVDRQANQQDQQSSDDLM